jgi:superfamily II RNA helicase
VSAARQPLFCLRCPPSLAPLLQGIKPSTFAGLLCALVTPFQVSRPEVVVTLEPSEDLQLLVEQLSQEAVQLASMQANRGIMCPIEIDLKCALLLSTLAHKPLLATLSLQPVEGVCRMAGIVEAWTWKVEWETLKESCDLDDGDTARLLCRVADLLRQVVNAGAVNESLRATARTAYKRIYRQPICDLLGI